VIAQNPYNNLIFSADSNFYKNKNKKTMKRRRWGFGKAAAQAQGRGYGEQADHAHC
jgi:hypothetical protein